MGGDKRCQQTTQIEPLINKTVKIRQQTDRIVST
jgi:hypothetical protein